MAQGIWSALLISLASLSNCPMGDIDDPDTEGSRVDGNYECLMDPERARERRQMAEERLHGGFLEKFEGVDFTAQRALLAKGRDIAKDSNQRCVRGDPHE